MKKPFVANRLLATSFYFELASDVVNENDNHSINIAGDIICRLATGSRTWRSVSQRSTNAFYRNYTHHNPL